MLKRPRRNRKTSAIRSLFRETSLSLQDFIMPFFVIEGTHRREIHPSLPGLSRFSKDELVKEASSLHAKGAPAVLLFPAHAHKDPTGSEALNPKGLIPETVRLLKKEIPSLCVLCDVALDPYTSHGHDGITDLQGRILNDETVTILEEMSLVLAESGVDFVAPSDMMDGRVGKIRKALDAQGHQEVGIVSYTAKYASSLYGPFRDTLGSHLAFGDKKTYQMDPANILEALREASLDEEEGADALLVKPALFYLDVLAKIKENSHLPVCAYQVSGEYAMILAAHEQKHLNAEKAFLESFLSMKRAGADCIISYALPELLPLLS